MTAYQLPRGLEVMRAPKNEVFEALAYFVDPFGTPWVAVATDTEDALWLPRYDPALALDETPKEPLLVEVADAEGNALSTSAAGPPPGPALPPAAAFSASVVRAVPDDASIYGDFWAKRDWVPLLPNGASPTTGDRDWNLEYQKLVDALVHSPPKDAAAAAAATADSITDDLRERIHALYTEFADMCQDAVTTIVDEMFTSQANRTIKATSMGLYFHRGACLRVCYDTSGGLFGGDDSAMKVAAQALRAYSHAASVTARYLIHMPLTFMMTHLGFRVLATTIPPIEPKAKLTADALGDPVADPRGCLGALLADCCRELGLKLHVIGGQDEPSRAPAHQQLQGQPERTAAGSPLPGSPLVAAAAAGNTSSSSGRRQQQAASQQQQQQQQQYLPSGCGLYWGRDGRLYLANYGRLLPPIAPVATAAHQQYDPAVSSLFWRLRPEVVAGSSRAVSVDAFLPGCHTADDNDEAVSVTQWLRDQCVPTVAATLSMLEPTLAETVDFTCAATGKEIRQQLGFVACCNAAECCLVSPQAYADVMKLLHWENQPEKAQELLDTYVKCGAPSRQPHGLIMKPDVTTVFHAHGLNLRYLPLVWAQLSNLARPCTAHYLEVEMIARASKELLWRSLRQATDRDQRLTVCVNFYLGLLQRGGELADSFWADQLGPHIASKFGVFTPFDMQNIDPFLVHQRVADLTGVELTLDSVASFYTESPFVQLEGLHPRMKAARLPAFVRTAGERRDYMFAHHAAFVALDESFRSDRADGNAAAPTSSAEDALVKERWAAMRPAYLLGPEWQ